MNKSPEQPERDLADHPAGFSLCPADAALVDRLLAGEPVEGERAKRLRGLLGLIGRWAGDDAEPGLAGRSYAAVLGADPVSLSGGDGRVLDALLALRVAGLQSGPMPADSGERAEAVKGLMAVLDRSLDRAQDEPVPGGLVGRTLAAVEHDRQEQRLLSAMSAGGSGRVRPGGFNIRQLATTAALLLMVLSVLLPMLQKGQHDAMVAKCGQNLAGLGMDLQAFADDNKGHTKASATSSETDFAPPKIFRELSSFASRELDGSAVPASRVNLFVLLDQRRVESEHTTCPSAEPNSAGAYYNGQNPVAGGPMRLFLQPRPIYADTNPLYRVTPAGLVRDPAIPGLTQSKNHDGVGQNVLISDGSVKWTVRPSVLRPDDREDNIWLLQRDAQPQDEPDVFLTP